MTDAIESTCAYCREPIHLDAAKCPNCDSWQGGYRRWIQSNGTVLLFAGLVCNAVGLATGAYAVDQAAQDIKLSAQGEMLQLYTNLDLHLMEHIDDMLLVTAGPTRAWVGACMDSGEEEVLRDAMFKLYVLNGLETEWYVHKKFDDQLHTEKFLVQNACNDQTAALWCRRGLGEMFVPEFQDVIVEAVSTACPHMLRHYECAGQVDGGVPFSPAACRAHEYWRADGEP